MNMHLALGKAGEQLAAAWLEKMGYTLYARNFRWGKTEIDIVATRAEWLHIIEVKTRRSDKWGPPELQVDKKKMIVMQRAAAVLLNQTHRKWVQYDIVAITWKKGETPLIELIEDVS